MTEAKGVRMACSECTLDCVMVAEGELPAGVNKLVEGVPYCPNCNIPMAPVGSVNVAERPVTVVPPDDATFAERLEQIRQAQTEVDTAKGRYSRAAETAKDLKKEWEGKVESLGSLIRRITQVPAPLPLFDGATIQGNEISGTTGGITVIHGDELEQFVQRLSVIGLATTREYLDALSSSDFLAVEAYVKAAEAGETPDIPTCLFAPQAPAGEADEAPDDDSDETPAEQPPARRRGRRGGNHATA